MLVNRKQFTEDLDLLNNKVADMGSEVIEAYAKLKTVLLERDDRLAKEIIDTDRFINDIEVSINVDGYLLIAKQCPVAGDLRRVITALKISNDLERIADYAVNIASFYLVQSELKQELIDPMIRLLDKFEFMIVNIVKAFIEENTDLALEIDQMDDELDELYQNEVKTIIKYTKEADDDELEAIMKAILAIKQIERAGDHVTNISENIIYLVSGKRVELN